MACDEIAHFYLNKQIDCRGSRNLGLVCNAFLSKYPRFKQSLQEFCNVINKHRAIKSKRLQPHVSLKINYHTLFMFQWVYLIPKRGKVVLQK